MGTTEGRLPGFLKDAFPANRHDLGADLAAGVTVALILVPQAMAYAQLAGLPPVYGLYASCAPLFIAALFGSCPQLSTGPVAMTSLLVFSVLSSAQGLPDGVSYEQKALLLAFLVGVILLLIAALRLTAVVNFISHPVMTGFTNAGVLIIIGSQLGSMLGLPVAHSDFFLLDIFRMLLRLGEASPLNLAYALLAIALIVLCRRLSPRLPGVLFAVAAGGALSAWTRFGEFGGAVVGAVPAGLPPLTWPLAHWTCIPALLPGACVVAVIGFMEVMAVTRVVAIKTRCKTDLRRELLGQGLARLAGSFAGAYPVSGSLSRTALNLFAGARTRFSSIVAGLVVLLTLLFLTPLLAPLPQPVLAGIIVAASATLLRFGAMRHILQANRQDGVAAWVTFAATLLLAPRLVEGILIGASLAVALFLYRTMRPHTALLARHADGTFRDARRHGLEHDPDVLLLRFEGRLYFANAESFEEAVTEALAAHPRAHSILIVGDGINELDASGEEMLRQLVTDLRENNIRIGFAELKWKVMEVIERTGLAAVIGSQAFFRTTEAGYQAFKTVPAAGLLFSAAPGGGAPQPGGAT